MSGKITTACDSRRSADIEIGQTALQSGHISHQENAALPEDFIIARDLENEYQSVEWVAEILVEGWTKVVRKAVEAVAFDSV